MKTVNKEKDYPTPPSEDFENAFSSGCGGCVRDCHCGRTLFDNMNSYDWEEGELEALEEKAKTNPGEYIALPYTVDTLIVNGQEYVMGCPCNNGGRYEQFLKDHCNEIAEYLAAYATKELKVATERDLKVKQIKQAKLGPGWSAMEEAPQDASDVQVRLADGKIITAHWACDLSGEEQPPFKGWFTKRGNGFVEVKPEAWKPLDPGR